MDNKRLIGLLRGKDFQWRIRQAALILSLLFLAALVAACSPQDDMDATGGNITGDLDDPGVDKKNDECPQLDSKLYQLSLMEDPIPTAEQWGFRVEDGKVFVVIVLADEETEIPEGFDVEVGTRLGDQVQALVPFDALCELANTEQVVAIQQPIKPVLE